MERLLILDSNSLMNRAFYAIPALTNSEGINTNAIFGYTNMIAKLKNEINPTMIAATFDKKGPTFRHTEYKEYKAGRKKMPPELAEQFPIVKELLKTIGIPVFEMDGYEADDIIGTLSKRASEQGIEVYVVTGDKDALQLASDLVNVVITKKGVTETAIYDEKTFIEEFGITPTQFIDVKGLMGDKSDNIPGIPGIGDKTAFKLISEYGSIEEVLNNIDKISGKKLKENLTEYREQGIFSKKLATIIVDMPVEFDFDEIRNYEGYNKEEATKLFLKLQMAPTLHKFIKEEVVEIAEDFEVIKLQSGKEINNIKNTSFIFYEISKETIYSKIEFERLYINSEEKLYIIDWKEFDKSEESICELRKYFEDKSREKVINNGKSLVTILSKMDIEIQGYIFDTEIAAYLLNSSIGKYELSSMMGTYLGVDVKEEDKDKLLSKLPQLYQALKKQIDDENMNELYYNVEHPLLFVLSHMERVGFKANKEVLNDLGSNFSIEIDRTQKEIYELSEEEFNINSPKQLGKILFEKLDLPVIKKTKTGYSTNAEVLEKLIDKHDIIPKIIYYRQITKINSTYIEGLKNVIDVDGCIHSSFNQTVTSTGRLSSTEPNLQNIPIKYEMGRAIRKVFIPFNSDDILMSFDYSQIELRVLANMAQDKNMIDAFNEHSDIHTKTASEVFKTQLDEVTPIMRSRAKAVNFGIVYGISDFSLAQDLNITKKEASQYMDIYMDRYPNIQSFLDNQIEMAKDNGFVLTVLNRRRYIPEMRSSNKIVKALGSRLAMNAPIQGSAADIIKIAMIRVFNKLREENLESKLILQVHDELILNVKSNEVEKVADLVKTEMESVLTLDVPLEVDMHTGKTWYEAK
ncbi:MAG: DNA polymerase I [Clostridium sp.]